MKKLTFSALFFSAIAWLYIGQIVAADGFLVNSSGLTTTAAGGGAIPGGFVMTNGNVNSFTTFTNNQVAWSLNSSGVLTMTNYAVASQGMNVNTNSIGTFGGLNVDNVAGPSIGYVSSIYQFSTLANAISHTYTGSKLAMDSAGMGGFYSSSDNGLNFSPATFINAFTKDAGVYRNSSGGVEINTGTQGTYTNLTLGSLALPTNYVAARFVPIAGIVKICSSNGVLYKVSQVSTQALDAGTP